MAIRIGELLLGEKRITASQLQDAILHQRSHGGKLGTSLISLGIVREREITELISRKFGFPSIELDGFEVEPAVSKLIPAETARKYMVAPLTRAGATLTLAMADPTNVFARDDVRFMTGYRVEPVVASEAGILKLIDRCYGGVPMPASFARASSTVAPSDSALEMAARALTDLPGVLDADRDVELMEDLEEISAEMLTRQGEEAPVIKLVNVILMSAIAKGATDIHIEPYRQELLVRYRIDGVVRNIMQPPLKMRDAITSRLKIMAKLDIAEKRLAQDGRIKIRFSDNGKTRDLDFRVSCMPILYGERIAMRLVESMEGMRDLASLGFESESLLAVESALQKRGGLILVTGPAASGKTTTLYSMLSRLQAHGLTIMTAEDPVHFELPGVAQVQIRDNIGLNFPAALRGFLRQDADAFLIGELRDFETADATVKAALAGRFTLAGIHTNDAPGTVVRLSQMGVEPFLVASVLDIVCAQRLVRKICPHCSTPDSVQTSALELAGFSAAEAQAVRPLRGAGCERCARTGYAGRTAVFELLRMTETMRALAMRQASASEIRQQAVNEGMQTLRVNGLKKVRDGVTTLEEVIRQTSDPASV